MLEGAKAPAQRASLARLTAALVCVLAAAVGMLVAAPAPAMAATYAYDTVSYVYDAPARLSSSNTVATDARGSPSGPGATSWETSVSVAGDVDAANTAGAAVPFGPGTEEAWSVLNRVTTKGSPFPGYKGGSVFENGGPTKLPELDGAGSPLTYREWDVNPYVKGADRGAERLVTGSDGSAYSTGDHYNSFLQFWGQGR